MKTSLNPDSWAPAAAREMIQRLAPMTYEDEHITVRTVRLLKEKQSDLVDQLRTGAPKNYESYRETVGNLMGIRMALEMLTQAERELRQGGRRTRR